MPLFHCHILQTMAAAIHLASVSVRLATLARSVKSMKMCVATRVLVKMAAIAPTLVLTVTSVPALRPSMGPTVRVMWMSALVIRASTELLVW